MTVPFIKMEKTGRETSCLFAVKTGEGGENKTSTFDVLNLMCLGTMQMEMSSW